MTIQESMADVLRAHWTASTHSEDKPFVDKCDGCGEVIFSWDDLAVRDGHEHLAAHQANALAAAGYRKPRTVSTHEDLDALPFEAVIRDAEGHVLERWGDAEHVLWSTPGCKWFVPATEIALPVTVLYEVTS